MSQHKNETGMDKGKEEEEEGEEDLHFHDDSHSCPREHTKTQ